MTTRIHFAVADVGYASDISDQRDEPTHIHAAASYPLTAPERIVIRAEEVARDQEYAAARRNLSPPTPPLNLCSPNLPRRKSLAFRNSVING